MLLFQEAMLVPSWLESLLSSDFFSVCSSHKDSPRSECNMFCLDCQDDAFCFYCRSTRHKDHPVIQIRRSSYHDVVRVTEIEKVLDISGVQTYVINSARVLFLNERPQPKTTGIKRNGDASFILSTKNDEITERMPRRLAAKAEEELREGIQQEMYQSMPPPPHSNSRRRKGIPQRAPLGP
nr:hypothetical protein CFP56_25315 [Quercus suber]